MKYWLVSVNCIYAEDEYLRKSEINPTKEDSFIENYAPDLLEDAWSNYGYLTEYENEEAHDEFIENSSISATEITEEQYNEYKEQYQEIND